MDLSDILTEESVFYFTGIANKDDLIARLAAEAAKLLQRDREAIVETLANREALGSTGLGNGIAIPHGKLPGLTRVDGDLRAARDAASSSMPSMTSRSIS